MIRSQRAALIAWPLLALLPAVAGAHDPAEQAYFVELPVVLTATRLQQPVLEAPASVTIIDRERIEISGVRDVADLFRLVPGFVIGRNSGHNSYLSYHGLSDEFSRRMQVLVDGRSIYMPSTGGVVWSDLGLTPDDIERIEVIRGPNAAAYGPNSFLAVINITTRHPAETVDNRYWLRGGSSGVQDVGIRHGGTTGDLDYRIALTRMSDEGFDALHDGSASTFLTTRVDWRPRPTDMLMFQAGLLRSDKETGDDTQFPPMDPERGYETGSGHLQLRFEREKPHGTGFTVQYYYNRHEREDTYRTGAFPTLIGKFPIMVPSMQLDLDVRSERHDIEFEQRLQPSRETRLVWGGSARLDKVHSPTFFDTDDTLDNRLYRMFSHMEYRPRPNVILNLGGMYEYNDITSDDFSPRAAVNYLVDDQTSLRFVASRATRTPVLIEELMRQVYTLDLPEPVGQIEIPLYISRGGLDSETIDSLEVGYHHEWKDHQAGIDVKLFQDRLRGLIRDVARDDLPANPVGDEIRSFENREDIDLTGIELQADARPRRWLRVYASASLVTADADDPRQRFEDSVPERVFSIGAIVQPRPGISVTADYYHHSKYKWLDSDWLEDGDGFLDLILSTRINGNSLRGGHIFAQLALRDLLADGESYPTDELKREPTVFLKAGMEF